MTILEKEVWVGLVSNQIGHYEKIGYEIPRSKDKKGRLTVTEGTKIFVSLEHLPPTSNIKLTKICDECGKNVKNQRYVQIIRLREKGDGKDRCKECGRSVIGERQKANMKYEQSFEYGAKKDNREYLLSEYSDKNDKKPNEIYYKTHDEVIWDCPTCISEYSMKLSNRTSSKNSNCPYCVGARVNHTNSLWTTHPNIAAILTNSEIGHKITNGCGKKVMFTCPDCKFEQSKVLSSIVRQGFSCSRCSDNISYPEKFIIDILRQLSITFEYQKVFQWSDNKRYDFYIPEKNIIIEVHGDQHYNENNGLHLLGRDYFEEIKNDEYKRQIAENFIEHYIILDCRESKLNYIKNSLLNSEIFNLYNFEGIDWLKSHEFACSSIIKEICKIWNSGIVSPIELSKIINLSHKTIIKYLKQGNLLGWCNYDKKEIMKKIGQLTSKRFSKQIVQCTKNGDYIKSWNSMSDVEREIGIDHTNISAVCLGKRKSTGGFKWMYKEDYDKLIKNKQLNNIQLEHYGVYLK